MNGSAVGDTYRDFHDRCACPVSLIVRFSFQLVFLLVESRGGEKEEGITCRDCHAFVHFSVGRKRLLFSLAHSFSSTAAAAAAAATTTTTTTTTTTYCVLLLLLLSARQVIMQSCHIVLTACKSPPISTTMASMGCLSSLL